MQKYLTFCVLFLTLFINELQAQTNDSGNGSIEFASNGPCIDEAERLAAKADAKANFQALKNSDTWTTFKSSNSSVVSFIWPLQQAAGFNDYGIHGVSRFVDHNPTTTPSNTDYSECLDYNCSNRTYDVTGYNHKGTDIYLWPFNWLKMDDNQGEVVAAAAGVIVSKVDGNYDENCNFSNPNANYIILQHSDNSQTMYWHLKSGSLTAKSIGSTVAQGEVIAYVGSSGKSTAPHLHFEVADASGNVLDPYAGSCNSTTSTSWWNNQKPYYDSAINKLSTHSSTVNFNPDNSICNDRPITNEQDYFSPGSSIYFYSFYRDQLSGQNSQHRIRRPDGLVYQSWNSSSSTSHYSSSYWYWNYYISSSQPQGNWTYEVTYQGTTYVHDFYIGVYPPNLTYVPSVNSLSINNTNVAINMQAINDGAGSVGATSTLRYYLSTNTTISTSDYQIGTDNVGNLSVNATSNESINVDVATVSPTIPDGTYYVGYYIDASDAIDETDENDNTFYWSSPTVTIKRGCTNTSACNYDPTANVDDGSCDLPDGCTDINACNYDSNASCDDNSCTYPPVASFTNLNTTYCTSDASVTLIPNIPGGVFSGEGISGNVFNPANVTTLGVPITILYLLGSSGCSDIYALQTTVTNCVDPGLELSLKVMLEGPYDATVNKMNTDLRQQNLIPLNQPYSQAPWNHTGTESFVSTSNIPNNAVDWVLVEMRTGSPSNTLQNTTLVETVAGIVKRNGTVVGTDNAPLVFNQLSIGIDYHILVRHRNHLDIISSTSITGANAMSYDFTTGSTTAFGTQQLKPVGTKFAMYAGDFTTDAVIQITDFNAWKSDPAILYIYDLTDANLDGTVQASDQDSWQLNKAKVAPAEVVLP